MASIDDAQAVLPGGAAVPAGIPADIFAAAADTFIARTLERLIDAERGRGCFNASLDTPTLAYAILRISEGFLYADVMADRAPDIDRAVTLIAALLNGLDRQSVLVER